MTDLAALAETIRRHEAAQGQPISRLGYFCAPFRPAEGPFADRVIKVYRGMDDAAMLERLAAAHDDYVAALLETGVPMPETAFHLLEMEGARVPVIVQEALDPAGLMRPLMQSRPLDETVQMMEAAGHYQGQERTSMQEQAGRAHMRWCDELSRLEGLERSAGRR